MTGKTAISEGLRKLAVLIDADNTSPKVADDIFEAVARIGQTSLRRIYGDFSRSRHLRWEKALTRHAILARQQFASSPGKNATDIALVIDAMDLLHSGRHDGFCLVSSDSDFTRLATRIREHGLDAYGIGRSIAPESYRQACSRFIVIETCAAEAAKAPVPAPATAEARRMGEATRLIRLAIDASKRDADGWFNLAEVGSRLGTAFDARKFGAPTLSVLAPRTGAFEVCRAGEAVRIRPKAVNGHA